jgi:hypothetical protein
MHMASLKLPRVRVNFLFSAVENEFVDCIGDAPKDGNLYGRKDGAWAKIELPAPLPTYTENIDTWLNDYLGYLNKFTTSSGHIAINDLGLVGAKFVSDDNQTSYTPPNTSTSEAQILVARGALKNYIASGELKWRTLAETLTDALLEYYYPSAVIPSTPDEKWVPHWLVNVNAPFRSREFHLDGEVQFTNGVGVAEFPMIFRVYSVRATDATLAYTYSPDAPIVGTAYTIDNVDVEYGQGSATITLVENYTGTALIAYSAETGPMIAVGEKCEANPVWRPLDEGEIACAADSLAWAYDLFQLWHGVTADEKWLRAMESTKKALYKACNISNIINYIAPGEDGSPVLSGGLTSYSERDPIETYTNIGGLIRINYPATTGEASISRWVGNHIPFSAEKWLKLSMGSSSQSKIKMMLDEDETYDPSKRWFCELLLDGNGILSDNLQDINLYPHDFYKSEGVIWGAAYGKTSSGDVIKSEHSSVSKTNSITLVNGLKREVSSISFTRGDEGGWLGWAQFMLSLFGHRLPMTISYKTSNSLEIIINDANNVKWTYALPVSADEFTEVKLTADLFTPETPTSPDILSSADYQSILINAVSEAASIEVEYVGELERMDSMTSPYYTSIGLSYSGSEGLDLAIEYIRPAPEKDPIPYVPYLIPFDYHIVDNEVSDLRGAVFTGYQAPWMFQEGVFDDDVLAVDTNLSYLEDAQDAYEASTGVRGFFAPVFWWDYREDYGANEPNTFGWHDQWDNWSGFQYRVISDVARVLIKDPSNAKATGIVLDFARAVDRVWVNDYTDFPTSIEKDEAPSAGGVDPHMVSNFMRALIYAMNSSVLTTNERIFLRAMIVKCLGYLDHYRVPVDSDYTSPEVEGTFSPSPETNEWYQFWGGDILDALGELKINKELIGPLV